MSGYGYIFADELAEWEQLVKDFSEDAHPRDEHGRFTSTGGSEGEHDGRLFETPAPDPGNAGRIPIGADLQVGDRVGSPASVANAGHARATGDRVVYGRSPVPAPAERASELKAGVARDLAERMKNVPYSELVKADPSLWVAMQNAHLDDGTHGPDGFLRFTSGEIRVASDDASTLGERLRFTSFDDPDAETLGREYVASQLVSTWANTSNDEDERSLAMQEVAKDLFGLPGAAGWNAEGMGDAVEGELRENSDVYRAFLSAQYDATQEHFADLGVESMTLYRGFGFSESEASDLPAAPDWVSALYENSTEMLAATGAASFGEMGNGMVQDVGLRPLSSFSYALADAQSFAESRAYEAASNTPDGAIAALVVAEVPVERILSTGRTGLGASTEDEVVVIGGDTAAKVYAHSVYIDPPEDESSEWA